MKRIFIINFIAGFLAVILIIAAAVPARADDYLEGEPDEIDTGISGRMAQVVAEKMLSISHERQVICVTHLPQIAAAADYHYLVQKTTDGSRTQTSVMELGHRERVAEVGRMISGADGITDESNAYAEKLIDAAEDKKSKTE